MNLLYFAALIYTVSVYGTMATMSIGAGVVAAAWLGGALLEPSGSRLARLRSDLGLMRHNPLFWPTVFFAFACLWSLAWVVLTHLEFWGKHPTVTWDDTRKTWHLFFPLIFVAVLARLDEAKFRRVAKTWLVAGLASGALGIVQHYVPLFHEQFLPHVRYEGYSPGTGWWAVLKGGYHANGLSGFHLSYAAIMCFPAGVFLAAVAVVARREGFFGRRTLLFGGAAVLLFIANILSFSKIAWVAMPLMVLLIALIGFKGRSRYALIGVMVLFSVVFGSSEEVRLRFGADKRTISERYFLWSGNLAMAKEHPVFGVGWHRNSELMPAYYLRIGMGDGVESHAHNNLLDQVATTGVFGLAGFLWLNAVLVWLAFQLYAGSQDLLWRSFGLGLVGGWFALHVNGMTQSNWFDAKVLHQLGWVTALSLEAWRRLRARKTL